MALNLAQLCAPWDGLTITGPDDVPITEVIVDSRQAGPGSLFVAVTGSKMDGHSYLSAVRDAGCRAVMVARGRFDPAALTPGDAGSLTVVEVSDTRGWPARFAREHQGRPDEELLTVGITGTNGKTTVACLLQHLLDRFHGPCGLVGTLRYETGGGPRPAPLTTPDGPTLYGLLAEMRKQNCRSVCLEVSSHALDQERTADLALDLAVLTNLGRDHLDYHGDQEAYLQAKMRILELLTAADRRRKPLGKLIVNAGDPAFSRLNTGDLAVLRYAVRPPEELDGPVDLWVVRSELSLAGTRLELIMGAERLVLQSPLLGRYNVGNLTAALAAGLALGFPAAECCAALSEAPRVPGRMQPFRLPGGAMVVIDYAHTPDALEAVLTAGRELTRGQLTVVFGCGGDRDRGKRPLMGAVAARLADRVWITTDNPRSEDPENICREIFTGCDTVNRPRARECRTILDRSRAIRSALAAATAGDLIVVAGKGHEDYQLVGDRRLHLDDSEIIAEWIVAGGRDG